MPDLVVIGLCMVCYASAVPYITQVFISLIGDFFAITAPDKMKSRQHHSIDLIESIPKMCILP